MNHFIEQKVLKQKWKYISTPKQNKKSTNYSFNWNEEQAWTTQTKMWSMCKSHCERESHSSSKQTMLLMCITVSCWFKIIKLLLFLRVSVRACMLLSLLKIPLIQFSIYNIIIILVSKQSSFFLSFHCSILNSLSPFFDYIIFVCASLSIYSILPLHIQKKDVYVCVYGAK